MVVNDLLIRNGLVVDGMGGKPFVADLAVKEDQIVAIGQNLGKSVKEIDAKDHIVTPGFVDLHTHLDAQVGWDPMLTPLSWHGVTTAILGNCGVTFAPCKAEDRGFLAGMMETVEDIPKDAILNGLPWNWESYGEYLDSLESLEPVINLGGLIGHCAVRFYVMGDRGVDQEPSQEEKMQMADIVRQAIKDGAVGFSTSRNPGHRIPDGRSVPGTFAKHDELLEIAKVVGEQDALMQSVMNMSAFEDEMALLRVEASWARVLFSHYTGGTSSYGDKVEAKVMGMRSEGMDVSAMVIPRSSGFLAGLQGYPPWRGGPWDELIGMSVDERLEAVREEPFSARLVDYASKNDAIVSPEFIFPLGNGPKPNYVDGPNKSLAAISEENQEHPAQTFIRMSSDTGGRALFTLRALNRSLEALSKAISAEFCLPGLGDAGAHVSQIMDSGWTTFSISHWHRDTNVLSLEAVIQQLTSAPARIIGLRNRGILAPGMKADINVINLEQLSELMPEISYDLPGGSKRFIQRAVGYRATICNGVIIVDNDQHTGARSGKVHRHRAQN